jgi:hypothetical protein
MLHTTKYVKKDSPLDKYKKSFTIPTIRKEKTAVIIKDTF